MEKVFKNCQSCGMPLKKDPQIGGSNADGSISKKYCSYCYANGKFAQADFTADQMQELVKNKMKEMGFPGFMAKMLVKGIPKLERWKSN